MRLSELAGKEMIDVSTGTRNGVLGGADLWIDEESGRIDAILLSPSGFSFGKKREETVIPWSSILRVGPDMIIMDSVEEMARSTQNAGTSTQNAGTGERRSQDLAGSR